MKNKDRFDLRDLDVLKDGEDALFIIRKGRENERIVARVDRLFDETLFASFLRWLEEEQV